MADYLYQAERRKAPVRVKDHSKNMTQTQGPFIEEARLEMARRPFVIYLMMN
jgi:hypothetical protein